MSWFAGLIVVLTLLMVVAVGTLVFMLREVINEAHALEDDRDFADARRRTFFDWINPFSWWKRDETVHLFYQRDARGRFRKVRRH